MKRLISILPILAAATILAVSCGKDYFPPVELSEDQEVSFANEIIPVFTRSCVEGCHPGQHALNLKEGSAYDQLVEGNYVDTLQPDKSVLYTRVAPGGNMPPGSKLPPIEIQKILLWIKQGAKNN